MHDQIKLIKSDVNRTLPSLNEGKLKIRFIVPLMSSLLNILIFLRILPKRFLTVQGTQFQFWTRDMKLKLVNTEYQTNPRGMIVLYLCAHHSIHYNLVGLPPSLPPTSYKTLNNLVTRYIILQISVYIKFIYWQGKRWLAFNILQVFQFL